MRFLEKGPSIPNELLNARDEGRVIFFCGAGVSKERAGLPDFLGLTDEVITKLGVLPDSPARKIFSEAKRLSKRTGVNGLISVDRIFGFLEREFTVSDIEVAVAKSLKNTAPQIDLSAHRILLDLATTPTGKVQLITTNFDRLFEDCRDSSLQVWKPPRLPDPSRQSDMDGIVYLHGCVTKDYSGAEGEGFVLSSSDFGRAYLSDGWATHFFREVLRRYIIVFIGYAADDPPILYLLEALNRGNGGLEGVYAFQSGLSSEAVANWLHKGVKALPYDSSDGHSRLWETLFAWSTRAKSPEDWHKYVLQKAQKGPQKLQPFERGQVAHIVSNVKGARLFSEEKTPPPAEWLCVFDPYQRYAKPGRTGEIGEHGIFVDPFDFFGLDSDLVPKQTDPDDTSKKRDVPPEAWDGLAADRIDSQNALSVGYPAIRGHRTFNTSKIPTRLRELGSWVAKVADQPTTIWWAAKQYGLHPDIQKQIEWQLDHSRRKIAPNIRKAWLYLFETWEESKGQGRPDWYELKAVVDKTGWNEVVVRRFASISKPYLTLNQNFWHRTLSPKKVEDLDPIALLGLDVEYPQLMDSISIPDEWVVYVVRELRRNLEQALLLETEVGGYGLNFTSSIAYDNSFSVDTYGRTHGLSGQVVFFSSLFERLMNLDISSAKQELKAWPLDDDTIFTRLRIWASGEKKLIPASSFGTFINKLSDKAFWSSYHKRDLLLVLANRWSELSLSAQRRLEKKILKGRAKRNGEDENDYSESRAGASLNRLYWLYNNGCKFSFNLQKETKNLRKLAYNWKPEYALKAADSMEVRAGFVKTETDYSELLNTPLTSTINKAKKLSGRTEDFLVEKNPFAGLSTDYPVRAFLALSSEAKRNKFPKWAWQTFLSSEARKKDKFKLSALIALRLSQYPPKAISDIITPTTDWLSVVDQQLAVNSPKIYNQLVSRIIEALQFATSSGGSAIIRGNKEPDWAMEAINSPVGKVARTLFHDQSIRKLKPNMGLPAGWVDKVESLLSMPGDLRRFALVIFSHNLCWFYGIAPNWTKSNLLSVIEGEDQNNKNAFWSGFFWRALTPDSKLYKLIKPYLLEFAYNRKSHRGVTQVVAGMALLGWGGLYKAKVRAITDEEMRNLLLHSDDDFRSSILWQLQKLADNKNRYLSKKWTALLVNFLKNVWPRQKVAKTPTMSSRLCDLAFRNPKLFGEIIEILLPLLTKVAGDHLMIYKLKKTEGSIIETYPQQTLSLLYTILPDNVTLWPHGSHEILPLLEEADRSLCNDERLLELKRKWDAR